MAAEAITFASAEALVRDYLDSVMTEPVVRVIPSPRPATFVRVMLTGTTRRTLHLADARVTIECWAPSAAEAEALSREVYGRMSAMDLTDGTYVPLGPAGWAGGPYADVDPDSGTARYTMTAIVRQPAIVL